MHATALPFSIPTCLHAFPPHLAKVLRAGGEVLLVLLRHFAHHSDKLVPPVVLGQDGDGAVVLLGL